MISNNKYGFNPVNSEDFWLFFVEIEQKLSELLIFKVWPPNDAILNLNTPFQKLN